jgi:hypothetical protein
LNQTYAVGFFSGHFGSQPPCNCTGTAPSSFTPPGDGAPNSGTPDKPAGTFDFVPPDNSNTDSNDDNNPKENTVTNYVPPPGTNPPSDTPHQDTTTQITDNDPPPPETIASVPEPATLAILGAGLAGFGARRRRKARKG